MGSPTSARLDSIGPGTPYGADGRARGDPSGGAVCRHPLAIEIEDPALAPLQYAQRLPFRTGKPVANQVVGIILVLGEVVPDRSGGQLLARRVE